jgi:iron complex transport system substrate-binding protein
VDSTRRALVAAFALAPVRAAGQPAREIVDSAGRRIAIPARVERVFAAGPPASVLVFAIAPDKLIGWTTPFRAAERPFVAPRYADLPTLGRLTGRGNTANVEVLIAAQPDVVIDYGSVAPTFVSLADRVVQQTGLPYALLDGSFDRMAESIALAGRLCGEPERAEVLSRYARATVDDIGTRVARVPAASRPRVYYARGPRGLETGLAGSINVESIERVGAVNVAAELGRGGLAQVSLEQVLHWNPDVIVTTDPTFAEGVGRDASWRGVVAVRTGRVHLAPAVPFGWIDFPPSTNRLIGLRWLAKLLHPQLFPQDLRDHVREFYTRFYHRTPDEAQLDALLASAAPKRP